MKFLVFTMAYNEGVNLERWVKYYGDQVGRENLAIIDHGSDDGSVERLGAIASVRLPRDTLDDYQRASIVSQFQQSLQPNYDAVVYIDCDEFLIPEPRKYGSLLHYLVEFALGDRLLTRAVGLNVVHMPDREAALNFDKPILSQRDYVSFHSLYCKPSIAKIKMNWEVGCHNAEIPSIVDPDLFLFHLRDMDYEQAMKRLALTRALSWADSNLEGGIGYHQRYSNDQYEEAQFLAPRRELDEKGALPFDFGIEIDAVNRLQPGDFRGRVSKIPLRFRDLL